MNSLLIEEGIHFYPCDCGIKEVIDVKVKPAFTAAEINDMIICCKSILLS